MSKVITGMDRSGSFRVYLTISTDIVEEARKIHDTTPLATAGLGRVLTGAGLMGLMLKNPGDKLTVLFKGDGPAKQILATVTQAGDVKGYIANPYVDLPLTPEGKLDVGGSLGIGEQGSRTSGALCGKNCLGGRGDSRRPYGILFHIRAAKLSDFAGG